MENKENRQEPSMVKTLGIVKMFRLIGPGIIIAASIIGPGTVTTTSSTGAKYGYMLLWCCIVSAILAYILNEPGLRWTLKTGKTMLEGIREMNPILSKVTFIALFVGALAYQTGNYLGAAMAINLLVPGLSISVALVILSAFSVVIAFVGRYKVLENVNTGLVVMMLFAFLITMFGSGPSVSGIAKGLIPNIPEGAEVLVLGLVGTTVCPDIPFAMSSLTKKKWKNGIKDLKPAKNDLRLNMILTGVVTCAIIICSATTLHPQGITVSSAADMAQQLIPVLGRYAGVLFALGLWAAGFSSAIYMTSCIPPMMAEAFGFEDDPKGWKNRVCVGIIALFPIIVTFVFSGTVPTAIIIAAQVLNTLILPISVILITILANKKKVLGEYSSKPIQNVAMGLLAVVVVLLTISAISSFM
ncbi:MAG: Nramp family divalent metal transporter [Lachnospiraceae bacterium]|jgi:manganese transport protein|nr:Nramp family divalent metal transporter [Lachnospiraceae bacterium]